MSDARFDIAHLARAELFSPKPQETLDFFTKFLGMYVTHRKGSRCTCADTRTRISGA